MRAALCPLGPPPSLQAELYQELQARTVKIDFLAASTAVGAQEAGVARVSSSRVALLQPPLGAPAQSLVRGVSESLSRSEHHAC